MYLPVIQVGVLGRSILLRQTLEAIEEASWRLAQEAGWKDLEELVSGLMRCNLLGSSET